MTQSQLTLMLAASRLGRWQRRKAENGVFEFLRTGTLPPSPEGISDSRWRGMLARLLVDQRGVAT